MYFRHVTYSCFFAVPQGKWIQIHDKVYYFSNYKLSFEDAEYSCKDNGGKLFEPKSESINNEVTEMAGRLGQNHPWLGIHDIFTEDNFVYASKNTSITWTNWDPNEPNDRYKIYGGEDCVELRLRDMKWNDVVCSKVNDFICEKEGYNGKLFQHFMNICS